ncbi:DUF2332 domain-containing protein [Stakelama tenebrarum]|uniref:DUF2332 family protein n=1 Tax=Stakelama tenebrarum TaxID=2711215 RepID=A0A6G6Y544_9SPHN|nr:DUF2332 family protein [Sphingosinithalassobacter tenebrarum]QIG79696.1 DUF2332 family protein [Sphingosinithalassobacter tenebrarum]
MNMLVAIDEIGELRRQAVVASRLGSPFVANILEAGERQLRRAPATRALVTGWPGDASAAALAMRFNAAMHFLARQGMLPRLTALYRREHDDFDGAVGAALAARDNFIAEWMRNPPQTNEVSRSAAIVAALLVLREQTGLPVALHEIGSSCGLNLNLARYRHDLGGTAVGDPNSPVRVAPRWEGAPPPAQPLEVVSARGVDLYPLDARSAATRERLLAHIWADQTARSARLEAALDLARAHCPDVEQGDAVPWLAERLAEPQQQGVCRVVFHSMVLQYLDADARRAVGTMLAEAGARATPERPLAQIGFEWTADRSEVRLTLTVWPTGEARLLATCQAYGDWIRWRR